MAIKYFLKIKKGHFAQKRSVTHSGGSPTYGTRGFVASIGLLGSFEHV